MFKVLFASVLLLSFAIASTALAQADEAAIAKAAQETLLFMPEPPLGFVVSKLPINVQGKLAGFRVQVAKDGAVSKVLINVAFGDYAERPARQAAYKGYVNGFVKGLASEGFKVTTNKFPDIEQSDFKTPLIVDLTFANDKGANIFVQKRIFFTTKGYDISAISSDAAEFKLLSVWASKIRPALPVANTPATASTKTDSSNELQAAIGEAIRLLEAKDYVGLFNNFVAPDDVKTITKEGSLADVAKQFGESKAPRLLQVLKAAKSVKPILDPTGTKAVFEFEGKPPLKLVKVANRWYLQN